MHDPNHVHCLYKRKINHLKIIRHTPERSVTSWNIEIMTIPLPFKGKRFSRAWSAQHCTHKMSNVHFSFKIHSKVIFKHACLP